MKPCCISCRAMWHQPGTPSTYVSTCPSLPAPMEPWLCLAMTSFTWPTHDPLALRTHGTPARFTPVSYWTCRVELCPTITGWYTDTESRTAGGRISSVLASISRRWELSECLKVKLNQCSQCLKVEIGNGFLITQGTATSDSCNWRHELSKKEVSKGKYKLKFCQSMWPHPKCHCELILELSHSLTSFGVRRPRTRRKQWGLSALGAREGTHYGSVWRRRRPRAQTQVQ